MLTNKRWDVTWCRCGWWQGVPVREHAKDTTNCGQKKWSDKKLVDVAGGKACQLGSTLRARRNVVRKSEATVNLKAQGEEKMQTQQDIEDSYWIWVNTCARLSDMLWDIYNTNIFLILIYLSTAIVLTPGGSSTVHIYTQTVHRITQWNRIHRTEHT